MFSVVKPFELFLENPLFGCGYETLRQKLYFYTYGMNTCTFINYFAIYGVLLGLFSMIGYYKFSRFFSKVWWERILILAILFFITATEDYVNNAFFYIIIIYGLTNSKKTLNEWKQIKRHAGRGYPHCSGPAVPVCPWHWVHTHPHHGCGS